MSSSYGLVGFDLAWFSSLSSEHLCIFSLHGAIYIVNLFLVTSFSLPFNELSLVWLALDLTLTNHCPSVLWCCWLAYTTHKIVSEMTYNVSSWTLNPTILYHFNMASLSRQKSSSATAALRSGFYPKARGSHPDRKPRRAVVLGRMRSELRERPAVYPAFALRATRGSSSLEDQTSSFSTDDVDVWHYTAVCCMPETTTILYHTRTVTWLEHVPHDVTLNACNTNNYYYACSF